MTNPSDYIFQAMELLEKAMDHDDNVHDFVVDALEACDSANADVIMYMDECL